MKKLSRKEFLYGTLVGIGAFITDQLLTACGLKQLATPPTDVTPITNHLSETAPASPTSTSMLVKTELNSTPSPALPSASADTTTPTLSPISSPTITSVASPDLVVVHNAEPEILVRNAISALGGIETFIPRGSKVIVKPNICVDYHTYEYAATTNPWVVATVVKLCLEAGASSVTVMDYPFGGTQKSAYDISGIREQVTAAGGEMVYMPAYKYVKTDIPNGIKLKQTEVFGDILQADVLINIPIAKQHNAAGLTLGMKNWMGVIRDRSTLHYRGLGQCIADLASRFIPRLTVVDAVRILVRNGPTGGSLDDVKKLDTVIVSTDFVAADSYATTLFGLKPEDVAYIPAAVAMGLGRSDLQNLHIKEINLGT